MTEDTGDKRAAADAFDEYAAAYVDSDVHRAGDDLDSLADWCAGADRALDVATGAGHTAGAILERGVHKVVAADAAPGMVRTAEREFAGVRGVVADAERLPFRDDTFDAVACRIAAHHSPDPAAFVKRVAAVLEPGGTFAFEDNIAPADDDLDAFLNGIERLRDPTHVRSHRESEWRAFVENAGFRIEESLVVPKWIDYRDWVVQLETPAPARRELESRFADPPAGATELFAIEYEEGNVVSFANLKLLVRATR
jgi:SAM-dependent methyltransferase